MMVAKTNCVVVWRTCATIGPYLVNLKKQQKNRRRINFMGTFFFHFFVFFIAPRVTFSSSHCRCGSRDTITINDKNRVAAKWNGLPELPFNEDKYAEYVSVSKIKVAKKINPPHAHNVRVSIILRVHFYLRVQCLSVIT